MAQLHKHPPYFLSFAESTKQEKYCVHLITNLPSMIVTKKKNKMMLLSSSCSHKSKLRA